MKKILLFLGVLFVFAIGAFAQQYEVTPDIVKLSNLKYYFDLNIRCYPGYVSSDEYNDYKMNYRNENFDMFIGTAVHFRSYDGTYEKKAKYTSSDPDVIKINGSTAEAVGCGTAEIKAEYYSNYYNGYEIHDYYYTGYITITVKNNLQSINVYHSFDSDESYRANDYDISYEDFSLFIDRDEYLYIDSEPFGLTADDVTWSSSNPKVVTVDKGYVKAVGYGKSTITAKYGDITDTINVNVPKVALQIYYQDQNKNYSYDDFEMFYNDTKKLEFESDPNGLEDSDVIWSSSDTKVAEVDEKGNIKAIDAGTAVITATYKFDSKIKDTVKITVPKFQIGRNIGYKEYDFSDFELKDSEWLDAVGKDGEIDRSKVKWSSSDPDIVSVDSGTVMAEGFGTATITAEYNGFKDTINVTVPVPTKLSIRGGDYFKTQYYAKLWVEDEDGDKIPNNLLTWTSSDPNVIEVNENGEIFGLNFGSAYVFVSLNTTELGKVYGRHFTLLGKLNICTSLDSEINWIFCDNFKMNTGKMQALYAVDEKGKEISNANVKWTSSDPNVAKVTMTGQVIAVNKGEAVITATYEKILETLSDTIKVTVRETESVKLNKNELNLEVGKTEKLTAKVLPDTARDKSVTWSSSNPNVATVDAKGTVKGISDGTATITVTTNDGGLTDKCIVTVKSVPVNLIKLDKTEITVNIGEVVPLKATVLPNNASNRNVTWKSSNTSIVKVNDKGEFKAYKAGKAKITAATVGRNEKGELLTASCIVTVNPPIPVTGVELDKTDITVNVGDITALKATVKPSNATNKDVEWKSSNTSIVKVNSKGEFKAYKAGKATVSVRTKDGKFIASCKVTVKAVPVTGVELDKTSITVNVGDITALTATVKPSNATNKDVEWKSSNTSIVKVNSKGEFKAYKAGKATVSVRTKDGKFVASCKVTVNPIPVTGVKLDKTSVTASVGEIVALHATVLPENATNKNVTWKSSDTKVVKVNAKGEFKTYKKGTATITVTTKDGSKTATCKVTVK